ncbi:MAG: hypothetical protein JRN68_10540, partial [Nitrososphaerota archaeon]|nr:hypothetical protein [Nitrososphaerota archaeon]
MNNRALHLIEDFRLNPSTLRVCSFAFSTRPPMEGWKAFSVTVPAEIPFYVIEVGPTKPSAVYPFISGINKESFICVVNAVDLIILVMKKPGKDKNGLVRFVLRKEDDFERAR